MRLDHFIAKRLCLSERAARVKIATGVIRLNERPVTDHLLSVDRFCSVHHGAQLIQSAIKRLYLMLHKPEGFLSATKDDQHRTVLDLIECPDRETLHLAGRLDRSSTGLILLSNDSAWTESLTDPSQKVSKHYLVETDRPIPEEAVARFAEGFAFETEGLVTKPAQLTLLGPCRAGVTLVEGRYHQIKRMFHRLDGIRLVSLHRTRIGAIRLPDTLLPGAWRALSNEEVRHARNE